LLLISVIPYAMLEIKLETQRRSHTANLWRLVPHDF
jgi:hypothetical protein